MSITIAALLAATQTSALLAATQTTALLAATQASAPAAPATSVQARFDQASQQAERADCAEAVAGFEAIENAPAIRRSDVARTAIAVRKGQCLVRLDRLDEAEPLLRTGLQQLDARATGFEHDRQIGWFALGRLLWQRFDYDGAEAALGRALALSTGVQRFGPLSYLAYVTAFDGNEKPLAYAAEALTLADQVTQLAPGDRLLLQTQRARVLLNQGKISEARGELDTLLKARGGLTLRVGVADVILRSDLALAALLAADQEGARRYLAYTGQGRVPGKKGFTAGSSMQPPACGGPAGLKPEDRAVVEFRLREDGSVRQVVPVYVPAGRKAAAAFAEAVSGWSWDPEDAAVIPEVFRTTVRVQIACSQATDRPSITKPLWETVDEWLYGPELLALARATPGMQPWIAVVADDAGGNVDVKELVAPMRNVLAAAEPKGGRVLVGALEMLASHGVLELDERQALLRRAASLAESGDAPPSVRMGLAHKIALLDASSAGRPFDPQSLRPLLARPDIAGDPLAGSTLRLLIATPVSRRSPPADAAALVDAVVAETQLPAQHPLKVNALLQQATLRAAAGDLAGARAAYAATGLTDEQCATLGVAPALRSQGNPDSKFPTEALRWGFEGWVRLEADIAPDGRPLAPRPVVAYPPYVFETAAANVMKGVRYQASFRPEGAGAACTARSENIGFRIP